MAVLRCLLLLVLIAVAQCFVAPPAAHAHSLTRSRARSTLKAGDDDDKPSLFQLAGQFYNELMPWGDPSKVRTAVFKLSKLKDEVLFL
jgi:hypothetical protein